MHENYEVNGVRVRLSQDNIEILQAYEPFINNETYAKKWRFLKKTILNRKQIRRTLDARKFKELERSGRLDSWRS
jgi:hypothetical protein